VCGEDGEGRICPYVILKDSIARQLAAYASMLKDLKECPKSITFLKSIMNSSDVPEVAKSTLLFGSIVKYARCFTNGEERATSLNLKDAFKCELSEHKKFHEDVTDLRNRYLAHAGNSAHESRAIVLILSHDPTNK
jgi:hypothetical protein